MSRDEIATLIGELFGPAALYEATHAGPTQHLAEKMETVRDFCAKLAEDEIIVVIAEEF